MIVLKSSRELELMKEACQISAEALMVAGEAVKPGVSTKEIDEIAYKFIKKHGATPNFLNYGGFPATACISINDEVIHGIPKADRILKEGDIVSIDLGAAKNKGIEQAVPGNRIGDIGHAVQEYCEARGYGVVRDFVGHGVGTKLHEEPSVPNFGHAGRGIRLLPGMTLAIEPMINLGTYKTADGKLAAHFEHSIAITPNGPVILTKV